MLQRAISLWRSTKLGMCDLIEGERVKVGDKISQGHFGEVFRGRLLGPRRDSNIFKMNPRLKESPQVGPCAIKKVKRQTDKYREDEELRYVFKLDLRFTLNFTL